MKRPRAALRPTVSLRSPADTSSDSQWPSERAAWKYVSRSSHVAASRDAAMPPPDVLMADAAATMLPSVMTSGTRSLMAAASMRSRRSCALACGSTSEPAPSTRWTLFVCWARSMRGR